MRKHILLFELFAAAYLTLVTEIDGRYIQKLLLLSWLETKTEKGVDKSRNMEHSGTCRNIPEHEKIKIILVKKNNNNNNNNNKIIFIKINNNVK